MTKRLLITGGCGFIGSNLAVSLAANGHQVICFDNFSRKGSELLADRVQSFGCKVIHGDIRCPEDFEKIYDPVDVLIECSAEPSVLAGSRGGDARYLLNVNLAGAVNCLEWARERSCGIIFMSTSRVYPIRYLHDARYQEMETRFQYADSLPGVSKYGVAINCPLEGARSLYGASKLAVELILEEYASAYDLPVIINRCGVVAGPWQLGKVDQGVFTYWLANHVFKRSLRYIGFGGAGKQVRDLLHVDDLCRLIQAQIERLNDFRAQRFNVGGGFTGSLSLLETTALCQKITGNSVSLIPEPTERPFDLPWFITDNGATESVFNWRPVHVPEQILQDTYNWLMEHKASFSKLFNA